MKKDFLGLIAISLTGFFLFSGFLFGDKDKKRAEKAVVSFVKESYTDKNTGKTLLLNNEVLGSKKNQNNDYEVAVKITLCKYETTYFGKKCTSPLLRDTPIRARLVVDGISFDVINIKLNQ